MLAVAGVLSTPSRAIIGGKKQGACLCGDEIKGDIGTDMLISSTSWFIDDSEDGPPMIGMFIIPRPLYMVLEMSLCAT